MAKHRSRTARIYYGPDKKETSMYWTVKVTPAKKPVTINGTVEHALRAFPGVTIGCALSFAAADSAASVGHPVHIASFSRSRALLVDKLDKAGQPTHAVLYAHNYKHITDWNDRDLLKRMVKDDPSVVERPFTLHAPRKSPPSGRGAGRTPAAERGKSGRAQAFLPRGALARAVKAGRIGKGVAAQIAHVAKRSA